MPPEYVPTRRLDASSRPTRPSSASLRSRPSSRGSPWSVACSSISSRPVISGSSAASWRATPILRRTSPDCSTTSYPATRAVPPVGRRSVVSIRTVVVLPAPFGPEEGIDLALGHLEVDPLDGLDLVPEAPLEARYFDCRQGWESTRRRRSGLRYASPCGKPKPRAGKGVFSFPMAARRPNHRLLIAAGLLAAIAASAIYAAGADAARLGQTARTPAPSCPKTPCQAVGRTTVIQLVADGRRGVFKAHQSGRVVAWARQPLAAEPGADRLLRQLLRLGDARDAPDGADRGRQAQG